MKKLLLLALLVVGCVPALIKVQKVENIIVGTWEGNLIINDKKLTFTFLNDGTLKTNFGDDGVLTWELKGDTLTFYKNEEVDDIVFLIIINENKFIIKDEPTDIAGMAFIRKETNPP